MGDKAKGPAPRAGTVNQVFRARRLFRDEADPVEAKFQMSAPRGANNRLHSKLALIGGPISVGMPGANAGMDSDAAIRFSIKTEEIHQFDPSSRQRM